jgi:hypothetical protein
LRFFRAVDETLAEEIAEDEGDKESEAAFEPSDEKRIVAEEDEVEEVEKVDAERDEDG